MKICPIKKWNIFWEHRAVLLNYQQQKKYLIPMLVIALLHGQKCFTISQLAANWHELTNAKSENLSCINV